MKVQHSVFKPETVYRLGHCITINVLLCVLNHKHQPMLLAFNNFVKM